MYHFFKISFCICCTFFLAVKVLAQEMKDTLLLEEVIIHVKKVETYAVGSRITAIDSSTLFIQNSSSLSDIIQFRTPLYIKSYGNGMLSTPSFRGTSASHTAVLWNGFNISLPSLGLSDFSTIPVSGINSIMVQHGSSSANYGTGAIGGAILLSSEPDWDTKLNVNLQQDFGSFGHSYSRVGLGLGSSRLQSSTQVYYTESNNDFKYANIFKAGIPIERQVNSALCQYGFTQDIYWKPIERVYISLKGWYTFSDRNIPPVMGANNAHDIQEDQNLRLMGVVNYSSSLGSTTLRAAFFDDLINFGNDNIQPAHSRVKTYQSQLDHELVIHKKLRLKSGLEIQHFNASVDGYGNKAVTENRGSGFALLRYNPFKILNISINLRQAFIQKFNPPITPSLGFNLRIIERKFFSTHLKASISRSYRVPTLNERFWSPGGNPELKPETGMNYEGGVLHKFNFKKITWESELTYFNMLVDNWIQWRPIGAYWSPINLLQVNSRGIEASSKVSYKANNAIITLGAIYAYTSSVNSKKTSTTDRTFGKQLIYVPLHSATASADASYKKWILSCNYSFISYRYTTSSNDHFLPGYGLMNGAFGKSIQCGKYRLDVMAKVNNIFNVRYQNMENRASPMRNYAISIRCNFNK